MLIFSKFHKLENIPCYQSKSLIDKSRESEERMESMKQVRLLSEQSKEIEREIVTFYKTVGKMINLNPRATEIFAYLKIYDALSQEQLKKLTGFSLGTISAILQSFLQTDIISRRMIPKTHKNLYSIRPERVKFDYTPPTQILEDLEKLDLYIVEKQTELQELQSKYPIETKFLHMRLNSLRNYIEAQRRQINRRGKYSFFQEDASEIIPLNEMIVYPFDTRGLEEDLMDSLTHFKNDPIRSRILTVFFTHRSVDQQTLMDISGFSRSTVSRLLHQELKKEYIHVLPREYRRPRIYYLKSISSSILSLILKTDNFIYSCIPRFQEILSRLQSERQADRDRKDAAFLVVKIKEIIRQIEAFRMDTRFLRQAHHDLLEFLEKDTV
jgi:DNA-binding transcriptional regulator GbsR (MarR family)